MAINGTYPTPENEFEDWRHFDDARPMPPVRTYVITPEMRANDERQRRERDLARASVWPIKATLSIDNLRNR